MLEKARSSHSKFIAYILPSVITKIPRVPCSLGGSEMGEKFTKTNLLKQTPFYSKIKLSLCTFREVKSHFQIMQK